MNKTALITGASSGIGLEFAREFAKNTIDVVLVARNEARLNEIAKELSTTYGIRTYVMATDLSKPDAAAGIFQRVKKENLFVEYLVNNAGFGDLALFADADWKKLESMISLNIMTLTQFCHLFVGEMKEKKRGRILNVASTAAFQPGPLMAVYYASKAYVLSFSEAINNELKDDGITVTALCPGPTLSGFWDASAASDSKLVKGKKIAASADVAMYGYKAMMRGKSVAIHGFMNRMMASSVKFVPRKLVIAIARKMTEKSR